VNSVIETNRGQPAPKSTGFPFLDLQTQFATIRNEVMAAVERVMESQHFILGTDVQDFETEMAAVLSCRYAFGCASGSDALLLALMALGIGAGDEVITTPFTFVATAGSIARLGARPVFVDIDLSTYNLDPEQIQNAITPRTKAVIPVHLFGLPAPMNEITKIARLNGLAVVEDAAQAVGARYRQIFVGNLGDVGCFSFFPSKNLGGAGDGGMVVTNNPRLANQLKLLRLHGCQSKYRYEILGLNSRLDSIQAAILRVKLRHLHHWTLARRRNAACYRKLFAGIGLQGIVQLPAESPDSEHVYNQFVIRSQQRDLLRAYLLRVGIPTEIYYPLPLHLQPAFRNLKYRRGDCPNSEAASRSVLALPIYPELTSTQQELVVSKIAGFFSGHANLKLDENLEMP
jgi:dTDP-4-amino-4,6-dideoxygalactose transaminase